MKLHAMITTAMFSCHTILQKSFKLISLGPGKDKTWKYKLTLTILKLLMMALMVVGPNAYMMQNVERGDLCSSRFLFSRKRWKQVVKNKDFQQYFTFANDCIDKILMNKVKWRLRKCSTRINNSKLPICKSTSFQHATWHIKGLSVEGKVMVIVELL